ncbi:MAG TPA: hypothetical protein VGI21_05110 [Streptosporangiaceae bacterium]|jgi:hypothetical protein
MPLSFPPVRPSARAGAWPWPARGRSQCTLPTGSARAFDAHEAMEKLATADDIAAAVRATGRRATTA